MRNMKTLKRQSGAGRRKLNTFRQTDRKHPRNVRSFAVLSVNSKDGRKQIDDKTTNGRYLAPTPKAAASKAFSRFCRENGKAGKCAATITIYETTRGNPHKKYTYNALRRTHEKDVEYRGKRRSQDIDIEHKYVNQLYTTKNVKDLSPGTPKIEKALNKVLRGGKNSKKSNRKNRKNKNNKTKRRA